MALYRRTAKVKRQRPKMYRKCRSRRHLPGQPRILAVSPPAPHRVLTGCVKWLRTLGNRRRAERKSFICSWLCVSREPPAVNTPATSIHACCWRVDGAVRGSPCGRSGSRSLTNRSRAVQRGRLLVCGTTTATAANTFRAGVALPRRPGRSVQAVPMPLEAAKNVFQCVCPALPRANPSAPQGAPETGAPAA
jgi:hypothetical protein